MLQCDSNESRLGVVTIVYDFFIRVSHVPPSLETFFPQIPSPSHVLVRDSHSILASSCG